MTSLIPPHLPSPAPTPDEMNPPVQAAEPDQVRLRADLESRLLRLSQDLYEMEVCAGEVGENMEDAVPNYLFVIFFQRRMQLKRR